MVRILRFLYLKLVFVGNMDCALFLEDFTSMIEKMI